MKKTLFATLLLSLSSVGFAAGLDCKMVNSMKSDEIQTCMKQADTGLKDIYQQVMDQFSEQPDYANALKDSQRTWTQFRDMDCQYRLKLGPNPTDTSGTLNACLVTETMARTNHLKELLQ